MAKVMLADDEHSMKTDFLVIGSGIAGLSYALEVAGHGRVLVLTKAQEEESNTKYAQGGIAAVWGHPDTIEKHVADTLDAGAGLCDRDVVEMVVKESKARVSELMHWGTPFDQTSEGEPDLVREGGHSESRILHVKDHTGLEIERALLEQVKNHPNIILLDHYYVVDLITQHHLGAFVTSKTPGIKCYGAYALNLRTNVVVTVLSKLVCVCSGGTGSVYASTTNPSIATGDGIAMVYRAKGKVKDMEFIQFHPTALYEPGVRPSFLISEAVRGMGGVLKTMNGSTFMEKYDSRGSLAPRDIVARAIDHELKQSGDVHVWLDCRNIEKVAFVDHFPMIYNKCLKIGIDPTVMPIPVLPSAHYCCGGIAVDHDGKASIAHLYAIGECAQTGLHGGNRLASNSLLEALVYAHNAAQSSINQIRELELAQGIPAWNSEGTEFPEEMILITESLNELRSIMSNYVGIVRSNLRLKRAYDRLKILHDETEALYEKTVVSKPLCELRNMIKVGYIIIKQAMDRKESVGLHYSTDYPNTN
jgi:L-aspartate oxidase